MSEGGVSYLNTIAILMQNRGYVYSVLLDFMDNSISATASLKYEQSKFELSPGLSACSNMFNPATPGAPFCS
jgi:hypothetical protein